MSPHLHLLWGLSYTLHKLCAENAWGGRGEWDLEVIYSVPQNGKCLRGPNDVFIPGSICPPWRVPVLPVERLIIYDYTELGLMMYHYA